MMLRANHHLNPGEHPMQTATSDQAPMPAPTKGVIAIYGTHDQAEAAVMELQHAGFDMTKLSIVGRGSFVDEHVVGYYHTSDRMKFWGKLGAMWGGITGLLFGTGMFFIPGIGPLLVAGPLVAWIVGALEGAVVVGGMSVIGAGLYSIGIPKNSILKYESALKGGQFLVIVHGTAEDARKGQDIIKRTEPEAVHDHNLENAAARASGSAT
jgi:hypothetical protein